MSLSLRAPNKDLSVHFFVLFGSEKSQCSACFSTVYCPLNPCISVGWHDFVGYVRCKSHPALGVQTKFLSS